MKKQTIHAALAAKLGREPTNDELRRECERIIGRNSTDEKCRSCGLTFRFYFLKYGQCNGCRNPHLIVKAVT